MKIKKVDDKPMVIHTKEKAKIHAHEPKGAKIKGSNIYTVERGPKVHDAKANEMDKKASAKLMLQKSTDGKSTYRKSTIHQSEAKDKGLSKFKRNIRESGTSIKTKNTNLHIAGRTGALAAGAVTEQVEGGHEVSQAAYLAYEASRPVTGTASKGAALFRKKAAAEAKKRIKKVEAGKKLAKKTAKKAAKDTAKAVAKETAKETAKTTAKVVTKTATKAAATAAGTAVAPGVGTAIGMAAGYAAGVSIEVKDEKMTNRSRKIKFFLDKMKAQENQTDSVAKLVKDLIVRKAITWVKAAAPIVGLVLLLLVLVVAMIAVPVIAVIAILYNSPFALFLPPLESGDTVQTVTSAYVQEFNRDVNTKVNEHTGYDLGELVYVDYEGMEENPSNYYDIMAVYMVKHGVGDTATVMNDTSKGWLQAVVNDMCSYPTSTGTKDVEETDADGNVTTVTKSVLYVNVTLKSYRDMISVYGFNSDHVEMLEQIMSPEFMGQLGYAGSGSGGGGGSPGVSSMTEDEINAILNEITDSRQKTVCSYALHRVGFPYSQDLRDSGNYYDCSSFVSMPRYRSNERDESNGVIYKDVCNPITAEFREELYTNILDAYARIKEPEKEETQKQDRTQEMPEFSVTVTPYEREGSNIKGLARIYFENSFIVNNINIVQGKEKIFVSMPSYKTKQVDEQGKPIYQDVCYPVTKDFREKLYNEIISEYEKAKDKSNEKARESAEKHHGNPDKEKDKEATPFR